MNNLNPNTKSYWRQALLDYAEEIEHAIDDKDELVKISFRMRIEAKTK